MIDSLDLIRAIFYKMGIIPWILIGFVIALYRGNPLEIGGYVIFLASLFAYKMYNRDASGEEVVMAVFAAYIVIGVVFAIVYLGLRN